MKTNSQAPGHQDAATAGRRNLNESNHGQAHILVCVVGMLMIGIMSYGFNLGNYLAEKYAPLVDAAMEIKLEATTAHLWLEEILSGEQNEAFDTVINHIDQSQWYAVAMLQGGENTEGKFMPINDPLLRQEIESVVGKIDIFRDITYKRFSTFEGSGPGTSIDQEYDAVFNDFISQADSVETKLQARFISELARLKVIQTSLIALCFLLVGFIAWLIYRFDRKQIAHMQLIDDSNNQLQKALDEVRKLQGTIPICGYCKNIRDEEGNWNQLEKYIHEKSGAKFSHGMCPDCVADNVR